MNDPRINTEATRLLWLLSEKSRNAKECLQDSRIVPLLLNQWQATLSNKTQFCPDCASPPEVLELILSSVLNLSAADWPKEHAERLSALLQETAALLASTMKTQSQIAFFPDGHDALWFDHVGVQLAKICNVVPYPIAASCVHVLEDCFTDSNSIDGQEASLRFELGNRSNKDGNSYWNKMKLFVLDYPDIFSSLFASFAFGSVWGGLRTAYALRGVADAAWRRRMVIEYAQRASVASTVCISVSLFDKYFLWPRSRIESETAQLALAISADVAMVVTAAWLLKVAPYSFVPILVASPGMFVFSKDDEQSFEWVFPRTKV